MLQRIDPRRKVPGRRSTGRTTVPMEEWDVLRKDDLPAYITWDQMIYHAEMVGRAVRHALVVVDMPFLSYHLGTHRAIENAGRVLMQTRCQAVKLEQGPEQVEITAALGSAGIPVMAHYGLRPQSIHQLGAFRVQRDREQLLADAKAAEEAGAFSILLECVPADMAGEITAAVDVPTIGIGAGAGCDGQILVINDLLGLTPGRLPQRVAGISYFCFFVFPDSSDETTVTFVFCPGWSEILSNSTHR